MSSSYKSYSSYSLSEEFILNILTFFEYSNDLLNFKSIELYSRISNIVLRLGKSYNLTDALLFAIWLTNQWWFVNEFKSFLSEVIGFSNFSNKSNSETVNILELFSSYSYYNYWNGKILNYITDF